MTNKHTPGPWQWVQDFENNMNISTFRLSPGVLTVDGDDGTPDGDSIDRANAHLIAAAPDLYEVCEQIIGRLGSEKGYHPSIGEPLTRAMQAALKKARGES